MQILVVGNGLDTEVVDRLAAVPGNVVRAQGEDGLSSSVVVDPPDVLVIDARAGLQPRLSALNALKDPLVRRGTPRVFLVKPSEEADAATTLQPMLDDYVLDLPDHLRSLPSVVRRAAERASHLHWTESRYEQAVAALQQSEAWYRTLFDASPAPMYVFDGETLAFLAVNAAAVAQYGYTRERFLDITARDIRPAEEVPRFIAQVASGITGKVGSWTHCRSDGVTFVADVTAHRVVFGGRGAWLVVAENVTERRHAEEERARLAQAVEQADEAILITDPQGTIVYVNPAFERVTGYSRTQACGNNPRILKSGRQDSAFYARLWSTLTRGETWRGHLSNRRKDGSLYEAEAVISPVRDGAGRLVNYVAAQRDVTHERHLEQQFLQSQKMEAVGRLAGGVAHDFNNLLNVITGYGELVRRRLHPDDPGASKVEQILKAADRAARLVRQLLAFSRRQVLMPKVLDLGLVVADLDKMLRRLIGEDIDLRCLTDGDLGTVRADPGQIEQVLMNLVVNARDAMPDGGSITIETRNVALGEDCDRMSPTVPPGRYVLLAVSDTGSGIDEETRAHIFEPFFTTKDQGRGTGLGLSTVYGIVKQSGGHISVYSETGRGTAFKIYLPRIEEPAAWEPAPEPSLPEGGSETVLLVEDEDMLRELLRESLEAGGYRLLVAGTGEEALALAESHDGPIHLLLTDVVMPGFNGRELAERLAPQQTGMKVLYISGYTDEAIIRHGVLDPEVAFLGKPFAPDALLAQVRRLLDGERAATP